MNFIDILSIVIFALLIAVSIYIFINKRVVVIRWMRDACLEAEKILGSGTGQAKLHKVYNQFVNQFPIMSSIIPFSLYSKWIDVALKYVREWIEKNENIANYME